MYLAPPHNTRKNVYMISVLFWAAFGSVIGWVAAILSDEGKPSRILMYVVTGAIGGLVGGVTGSYLDPQTAASHSANTDSMFAIFGAVVFVGILGLVRQKHTGQ
jgi:uncharacterized membrane protein YeaQ/YmgE (transglycosylase-associated protein family)